MDSADTRMHVFDRGLVRLHRVRAAARFADHDFLFREVGTRLSERLDFVKRRFPVALNIGGRGAGVAATLVERLGIQTLTTCDIAKGVLAHAAGLRVVADEEVLPFGTGAFDLVLSCLDLHWVNDLPGLLHQVRRILKPDGLFIAAMFGGDTLHELRRALLEAEIVTAGGATPRVSPFAGLRDVAGLMQRAGFALPVVDTDIIDVDYADIFALMRDLRGMGETNAVLTSKRSFSRRDTFAAAAARHAVEPTLPPGRIPATFQVLYLTGWAPAPSQPRPLRPGSAEHRLADALGTKEQPFRGEDA